MTRRSVGLRAELIYRRRRLYARTAGEAREISSALDNLEVAKGCPPICEIVSLAV